MGSLSQGHINSSLIFVLQHWNTCCNMRTHIRNFPPRKTPFCCTSWKHFLRVQFDLIAQREFLNLTHIRKFSSMEKSFLLLYLGNWGNCYKSMSKHSTLWVGSNYFHLVDLITLRFSLLRCGKNGVQQMCVPVIYRHISRKYFICIGCGGFGHAFLRIVLRICVVKDA